jgi:hypothetical protein
MEDTGRANSSELEKLEKLIPAAVMSELKKFLSSKEENDVWDVYNTEAMKEDRELVKDWQDSLNALLLFVSLHPRL